MTCSEKEGTASEIRWLRTSISYLSPRHRDARGTGCALAALAGDLPRLSLATRSRFADGVRRLKQILADTLRRLECADADALADSMLAEMAGVLAIARTEPDRERADARTRLLPTRAMR